jgi:hypothetical protein
MEKDCIIISWGADTVIHLELDHIKEPIIFIYCFPTLKMTAIFEIFIWLFFLVTALKLSQPMTRVFAIYFPFFPFRAKKVANVRYWSQALLMDVSLLFGSKLEKPARSS